MSNFLRDTKTLELLGLEEGTCRPSWYGLSASYIRGFNLIRHSPTSNLLPNDRRITMAARRLYRRSDVNARSVMDGTSTLSGREKSKIFNRLVHQLAVESGMTAAALLPPAEETKEEIKNEPNQLDDFSAN